MSNGNNIDRKGNVIRERNNRGYDKITIDIETDGLAGKFLVGGIYNIRLKEYMHLDDEHDFWNYVLRLKRCKIYAHFGGKYDYQYLMNYILKYRKDLKFNIIYNSKIILIKIGSLYFYDTYNIFLASLGNIEKAFNIDRQQGKETAKKMSVEYYAKNKQQVIEYLKEDCVNLATAITKFESMTKTKMKATIASTAFNYFFNSFSNGVEAKFEKQEPFLKDFLRQGYFGGRTEVFKRYGEQLYYYDINSSYPYIMRNFRMPINKVEIVKEYVPKRIGFYDIVVTNYQCILPYIAKKYNGKLVYPEGTFQAYVTNLEIEELIKDKQQFKIVRGYVFNHSEVIFKEYIDYFYNLKKEAKKENNQAMYLISKLFMNSLYGKFAERETKQNITRMTYEERLAKVEAGYKITPFNLKYDLVFLEQQYKSEKIQVQISSYITAMARFRLYRIMRKLLENNFEIYYCDTDSIVTNANVNQMQALGVPIHDSDLGALKLEQKIERGYFVLPKFYNVVVENKSKSKNKGFTCNFNEDLFKMFLFKNQNDFRDHYNKMIGFKEGIKRFGNCVMNIDNAKEVKTDYDKRQVLDDNITTKPLYIFEFDNNKDYLFNSKNKSIHLKRKINNLVEDHENIFKNNIDYTKYIIVNNNQFDDGLPF